VRKEIADIVARLGVIKIKCFTGSGSVDNLINEVITLVSQLDKVSRPDGAHPAMRHATVKEIARAIHDPVNVVVKQYTRNVKRLYALKIVQWYVHLAIEKLETVQNSPK